MQAYHGKGRNHHLAVAFANAQLYDMAITDSMTMLYTRRHFKRKLVDFIEQYHETGKGFGLLMIDDFSNGTDRIPCPVRR